jgi:hypothetical protein
VAAFAITITVVATRHGPFLSPDSVTYVSLTRSLGAGRGYVDLTGRPNTTFTPGLPLLLASMRSTLGVTIATASRLVNVVSFVVVVGMAWCMLQRHTRSRVVSLIGEGVIVASPAMLDVADHLWSEIMFSVAVLVFLIVLEEAVRRVHGSDIGWYLAAGALAGVACLVRYAGVPLVAVGVLCAAAAPGHVRNRGRRTVVFLAAALPLPLLWAARNAMSGSRYVFGPRVASPLGLEQIVDQFLRSDVAMFVRGLSSTDQSRWAIAVAIVVPALAVLAQSRRRVYSKADVRPSVLPVLSFVVAYSLTVIVAGKTTGSSVDTRIVMPLLVPVVVLVARGAAEVGTAMRSTATAWGRPVLVVCSCVAVSVLVAAGDRTVRVAWEAGRVPRGYVTDALAVSPLARAVHARVKHDEIVTTNSPWELYRATGHVPIVPTPGPLYPSASLVPLTTAQLAAEACRHRVYFAWYATGKPVSPDLGVAFELRVVAVGPDGALYRVSPPSTRCVDGRVAPSS